MSSSSSGYMDGVPVKISEKYKPPRRIIVPQNVFQRINVISEGLASAQYDTTFEQNVLEKIREWRTTKEKQSLERRARLNQAEEHEKQSSIEKAAAENEARRKQLTEVSYPSTDDLSELSSEGDLAASDSPPECPMPSSDTISPETKIPYPIKSLPNHEISYLNKPMSNHDSILQPQLINTTNSVSLAHKQQTMQSSIGRQTYKINYSDFENDTSSPFDNMELKTINDIELLAQVLSNTQVNQQEGDKNQYAKDYINYVPSDITSSFSDYKKNYGDTISNQQPNVNENYSSPMNFIGHSKITNKMPNGYYNSQYSYNFPVATAYTNFNSCNQPVDYNYPVLYDNSQSGYFNSNKVFNHQTNQYSNVPDTPQNPSPLIYPTSSSPPSAQKSKSRSVPDIVKELEDELSQAKEIMSKRSQNASPATCSKISPEFSRSTKQIRTKSVSGSKNTSTEVLDNPYKDLSPKMQKLAFHISQMGFPLPRTARACVAIGDDDKKVIEYLLAMDQLMDLGFSETRVSAALLKFNNDRDKALDFLIT